MLADLIKIERLCTFQGIRITRPNSFPISAILPVFMSGYLLDLDYC